VQVDLLMLQRREACLITVGRRGAGTVEVFDGSGQLLRGRVTGVAAPLPDLVLGEADITLGRDLQQAGVVQDTDQRGGGDGGVDGGGAGVGVAHQLADRGLGHSPQRQGYPVVVAEGVCRGPGRQAHPRP